MKNQNYFKPQRTEGVRPLSAIDSKINKKFSQSDWAHNAEDWLTRQEGWEDSKPSSQQAIGAHILRIEKLSRQSTEGLTESEKEKVEARNSRNKERLKKALIDKIIVKPEKALESELRALHNMYGRDLSDNEVVENFLNSQREKLGAWIDYLDGGTGAEIYPTWFKIYVMDGVENMGRYNAEKGMHEKRSSGTVAEFPELNPAALAKTFDVVNDFYVKNNKPKEEKELELFNSGSFNRIYSKIKNETTFKVKIPEWFGDIKGSWKEYDYEMKEELMKAAQGTSWCVDGSYAADNYLGRNGAKFYLLHLEDPETGALSETAAASIRMENDEVAEISGVRDGKRQSIDISLLPSVIEKLDQLPGGDYYTGNLEHSLELIKGLSEKAKRDGLSHALDEIRSNIDKKIHFDEGDIIVNNLEELKKDFTLDEILANVRIKTLDPYIKAGFTAEEIFEKVNTYGIDGFKSFVKAGFDKFEVFEKVDGVDKYNFESYIEAGIPLEKVFDKVNYVNKDNFNFYTESGVPLEIVFDKVDYVDKDNFNFYVEAGIPLEKVFDKVDHIYVWDFNFYVKAGVLPETAFKQVSRVNNMKEFNTYTEAGVPPEKVFEKIHSVNAREFSFYVEADIPPEKVFDKVGHIYVGNFNFYVEAGVPPEKVFDKVDHIYVEDFNFYVEADIPLEKVFDKVDHIYVEDFNFFVGAGVPLEIAFEKAVPIYAKKDFEFYIEKRILPEKAFEKVMRVDSLNDFKYFIDAGVPSEKILEKIKIHPSDLKLFIEAGAPPEKALERASFVTSSYFRQLIEAGLSAEKIFERIGRIRSSDFRYFIEAGILPEKAFKKVDHIRPSDFRYFIEAGILPEKAFEKVGKIHSSYFKLFVKSGISPDLVFERIEHINMSDIEFYVSLGVSWDIIEERFTADEFINSQT